MGGGQEHSLTLFQIQSLGMHWSIVRGTVVLLGGWFFFGGSIFLIFFFSFSLFFFFLNSIQQVNCLPPTAQDNGY